MHLKPRSHGNAIVSFHSSVPVSESKNGLFARERNDCVSAFASVHTGTQSFRSTIFLQSKSIVHPDNRVRRGKVN